jgi:hypothetical protein
VATIDRMHRDRGIASLAPVARYALVAIALLAIAACGPRASSSPATSSAPASKPPAETDVPTPTQTFDPNLPGQTETEWGPIWDAVPGTFPVPEGATPAEPETGPASAAYTVPLDRVTTRQLAEFYRDGLDVRGYSASLDGPLEDGSFTVWSSSGYGCDVLVTILPRGGESLITVLYGTGCAFE